MTVSPCPLLTLLMGCFVQMQICLSLCKHSEVWEMTNCSLKRFDNFEIVQYNQKILEDMSVEFHVKIPGFFEKNATKFWLLLFAAHFTFRA